MNIYTLLINHGLFDKGTVTIVVLNDGETFTDLDGCKIMSVKEEEYYSVVNAGGDANDFTPVAEITL